MENLLHISTCKYLYAIASNNLAHYFILFAILAGRIRLEWLILSLILIDIANIIYFLILRYFSWIPWMEIWP